MEFDKTISWDTIISSIVLIILAVSIFYAWRQYKIQRERVEGNYKKGELRLLYLVSDYAINTYNMYDEKGKFKKDDPISTKQYIEEAKVILQDLHDLLENPFYINLLEKYPDINLAYSGLRRNIIEQEIDRRNSDFALSYQTFKKFYEIYNLLKGEIGNKKILESEYFKSVEKAYEFLEEELGKQNVRLQ